MAFTGFGAKPAATGTTGTGLFGATTGTNPFGGGLFGQNNQQNTNTTGGGLFGSSTTAQPSTGGTGLFGQQQNAPTGGGLFGQQPATTGGGLFGTASQQPQQQTGTAGGLFGQSTQQQQPAAGGGLFGSTNANSGGGGLFGTGTSTNAGGSGLFGANSGTQNNATGGGSLFGSTNAAGGAAGGGLFSTNTANPLTAQATQPAGAFGTAGGFGGSTLFKQPSQAGVAQQSQQPQNQLGLSLAGQPGNVPFTKSTKFNDLPEQVRKTLESIDAHIQGRVQISKDLQQRKLGEEPTKGQVLIKDLHKELVDITNTIRNDAHLTQDLKDKVEQAVQDTIVTTRIVEGWRNPQSGSSYLKDHASFPLEYFTRITEQMSQRLAWYKTTIEQIERKLSSSSSQGQTPQGIVTTLQTQHATFLALASKTAALDTEIQRIKAIYTQLWRSKTGSVRDPFTAGSGGETGMELGMSSLNLSVR